ncbi:MAG: hypothetical protein GY801_31560 [bacterium]|nr:hypothetical protein [bacterium]
MVPNIEAEDSFGLRQEMECGSMGVLKWWNAEPDAPDQLDAERRREA